MSKDCTDKRTAKISMPLMDLLDRGEDCNFLSDSKYTVIMDYPFETAHKFVVSGPMTAWNLAVRIAQEYDDRNIFDTHLGIDSLIVDYDEKIITMEMYG